MANCAGPGALCKNNEKIKPYSDALVSDIVTGIYTAPFFFAGALRRLTDSRVLNQTHYFTSSVL